METVFRKIHFIVAYAETIIKRFSKGVIYRPVLQLHAIGYYGYYRLVRKPSS